MTSILRLAIVAAALGAATAATAATYTPAVTTTSTGELSDGRPFTLGYSFSLSSGITIDGLGYWDDGRANDHQVGIWDSVGNLVVSGTVLGTGALQDDFRWLSITSTVLAAGNYVIGGEFLGDGSFASDAVGVSTIPEFTWGTDLQIFGSGLNFPTGSTSGSYGPNGILVANFSVAGGAGGVPEPATWAMMLVGFGSVGFAMRRTRQRQLVPAFAG